MKKLVSVAITALLAIGGVALTAAPASAHTGKVNGVASCEADGTYTVTWTYNATNVPNGVEAETKAMTTNQGSLAPIDGVNKGGQIFLSVWSDHQINVPGAPVKTGNWSAQFKTVGIPGSFKGDVTTMVQTDWRNGPSEDPVGKVYVDGSCKPPVVVPEKPAPTVESVPVDTVDCKARVVTTVTTTTTTDWKLVDNVWVKDAPVVTTATTTRAATPQECAPPPTNTCTAYGTGPTSTNLVPLWGNVDTRSAGHYEYVEDGLHIWTDDASSNAKVSLGYAANFDLKNTGVLDLDWTGSTPPPGINLFIQTPNGNGTLVYESVYGQDLWLTNGSAQWLKDNAPVNGGGNGSQWHGTIDQWLTVIPDAKVVGIAFSLGSGVKGDGVINSITAGCTTYHFDYVAPAPKPEPQTDTDVTVVNGEWSQPVIDCDSEVGDEQTLTREVTTTTSTRTTSEPTYDPATNTWTQGPWGEWVAGEPVVTEEETTYVVTAEDIEALDCPVTPTPNPTPSETPVPAGGDDGDLTLPPTTQTLAQTGGASALPWALGGSAVILAGLSLYLWTIYRRNSGGPVRTENAE